MSGLMTMGLVGRLEDLPIPDIVQIVYLSRGTGVLELRLPDGRHSVLFRGGLMVNATSPAFPSLRRELEKRIPDLSRMRKDVAAGTAALEMTLIAPGDLQKIVTARIVAVVRALCDQRHGEFEFVARQPLDVEVEYDPGAILPHGGIRPDQILGKNPVRLRTLGTVKQALGAITDRVLAPLPKPPAPPEPQQCDRSILLIDDDPSVRQAIRRAASNLGIGIVETGMADAHRHVADLFESGRPFAAVVSIGAADPRSLVLPTVQAIKQRNRHVPVTVIDSSSDYRNRHLSLEAGADWYMRKPAEGADDERVLFAADLLLAIDRRLAEQKPVEMPNPQIDPMHRGFRLLAQLMKEVSAPGDLSQVTLTVLQLAADFIDRGVLLAIKENQFITLGKFGVIQNGSGLRFRRGEIALLDKVAASGRPVRGKIDGDIAGQIENAFGKKVDEVIVLPMLNGQRVVGVLYGDNAGHRRPIDDTLGLEIFLTQAGFAFHNLLFPGEPLPAEPSGTEFQLV